MLEVGIGSWTYPWAIGLRGYPAPAAPLTAQDLLARARLLGVRVVQIADNLPLHELPRQELCELRAKASDAGLTLEAGTRGVTPDHLRRYLEIAHLLQARLLRTVLTSPSCDPTLEQAAEWIAAVLPEFSAAGVSIAFENYERHSAGGFAWLVEALDSPFAGICLDTVNSMGALETPEHVLASLLPFVLNVHVKDFDIVRAPHGMGYVVAGRPAGGGRLNVPWLLERVLQAGRKPSVIIELWPPLRASMDETIAQEAAWARRSVDFVLKCVREQVACAE